MWNEIGKHAAGEVVDKATSTITSVKYIAYTIIALIVVVTLSIITLTAFTVIG